MNMQGIQLQQPTNRKNRKRRGGASFFHSNKMNWSIGPLRAEFTSKQCLVPKHCGKDELVTWSPASVTTGFH